MVIRYALNIKDLPKKGMGLPSNFLLPYLARLMVMLLSFDGDAGERMG